MSGQERFKESNEEIKERYDLASSRISSICGEETVPGKYRDYFCRTAEFICLVNEVLHMKEINVLEWRSLKECEQMNEQLYAAILPERYEDSYANPAAAVRKLGDVFGGILCFLFAELRSMIGYAFEGRKERMTIWMELFVEIYNCFESDEEPDKREVEQIVYWFFHDYSEVFAEDKVRHLVDPAYDYFTGIVMESDLSDLRYLYRYGEYIGGSERQTAEFLNTLSEAEICAMADTMTDGFRIGYEKLGKDLSRKDTVCLEYPVGFERVIRAAVRNFKDMGLEPTIYRNPVSSFASGGGRKRGCYTKSVNKQFEFDHKADSSFYLDKAFVERRLRTMQLAFETYKKQAGRHAGPAVTEMFGEAPFEPKIKPEAPKYTGRQNALNVYQMSRLGEITNTYIPGDERSFTIISYPIPAIGPAFEAVFRETVRVNTLDSMRYCTMQQKMIDVLDLAQSVHVTGKGGNRTDL